jgi:hypothetical protein
MSLLLDTAIVTATKAHVGQTDKQGVPYIFHPLRVAELVRRSGGTEIQQAVAVFHDVIEDTRYDYTKIALDYGFYLDVLEEQRGRVTGFRTPMGEGTPVKSEDVLAVLVGLRLMTKEKGAPNDPYIEQLASSDMRLVKWADTTDNWARLDGLEEADRVRLTDRYRKNFEMLSETKAEKEMRFAHLLALRGSDRTKTWIST